MKVIIAGSRSFSTKHPDIVIGYIAFAYDITEVVSGGAKGADLFGEYYAKIFDIPARKFLPNWDAYGKRAGILRNEQMGNYADALIALWDGKSRGTKHMIDYMGKLGKPVSILFSENWGNSP